MRVRVETPLRATEIQDRVVRAATAFWPEADLRIGSTVEVRSDNMVGFRDRVWELRIIDTIRSGLLAGADGDRLRFRLDKQAAANDRVSFPVGEGPLGDVMVEVTVEPDDPWQDAEDLVHWICPPTKDGHIVEGSG